MLPGDLVFFGSAQKATHVGPLFREGFYIHSSGQMGRNKIGLTSFRNREMKLVGHITGSYALAGVISVTNRRAAEDKEISQSETQPATRGRTFYDRFRDRGQRREQRIYRAPDQASL